MKILRKFFAAVALFAAATVAQAGIPVIDGTAILNMVTQYNQLLQQYQTLNSQLQTAQATLNSMSGARGMAGLLTDPTIRSQLPADWSAAMGNIRSTGAYTVERAKLPSSANPKVNAVYDSIAVNNATMVDFFKKAHGRLEQVAALQQRIDIAPDPAAKADLQNRIASEQNAIAGTTQLLAILKEKQAQEVNDARQSAQQDFVCKEFKRCP